MTEHETRAREIVSPWAPHRPDYETLVKLIATALREQAAEIEPLRAIIRDIACGLKEKHLPEMIGATYYFSPSDVREIIALSEKRS